MTKKDFYHFYHDIFELWYEDLKHGHYISISFFEDLLMIFQGRYPRTCGMIGKCQIQLVIEGDGTVYPCDFYALDQYCLGNITVNNIDELRQFKSGQIFLKEEKRTSSICKECQFKNICHGQCKRMNIVYFDDNYCGYQESVRADRFPDRASHEPGDGHFRSHLRDRLWQKNRRGHAGRNSG